VVPDDKVVNVIEGDVPLE